MRKNRETKRAVQSTTVSTYKFIHLCNHSYIPLLYLHIAIYQPPLIRVESQPEEEVLLIIPLQDLFIICCLQNPIHYTKFLIKSLISCSKCKIRPIAPHSSQTGSVPRRNLIFKLPIWNIAIPTPFCILHFPTKYPSFPQTENYNFQIDKTPNTIMQFSQDVPNKDLFSRKSIFLRIPFNQYW